MSDWSSVDRIGVDITSHPTSKGHTLGEVICAKDMAATEYGYGEFMYAKGLDSTAVGECVIIDGDDYSTKLAVADDVGRIGFAMSACLTGEFGWYQVRGKAVSLVSASAGDNAAMYLTATPGTIDDAVVAGDRIHRCESASAIDTPSTGLAEMDIDYPHTDNIAD